MTELLSARFTATAAAGSATDSRRRRTAIVATVTTPTGLAGDILRRLPAEVTGLEVRADLVGDVDPRRLRRHFPGELIYTLRSNSHDDRRARLLAAAEHFDLVNLEAPHDLTAELLAHIPGHQRWISWPGTPASLSEHHERLAAMTRVPARLYVLAPTATGFDDALAPLRLLVRLGRRDVTGFGVGPAGAWSRILAPWLGAPVVFGDVDSGSPVDSAPSVEQLLADYPFPALPPLHSLFGIVGRSTNTSLFLRLFNAAFDRLAMPSLFLPFSVPDEVSFRTRFWPVIAAGGLDELGAPVRGFTVTAPYKQTALTIADVASRSARAAMAVNLLLRRRDGWLATTTDGTAVVAALSADDVPIKDRRVAVIGCGGAGRAVAAAFAAAGAAVTVVNRGQDRGRYAADLLGLGFVPLDEFIPTGYAVVVHATPAGDELLFDVDGLAAGSIVVDFVCAARPTALITAAGRRGLRTFAGQEVLKSELAQQFRLMTGQAMP